MGLSNLRCCMLLQCVASERAAAGHLARLHESRQESLLVSLQPCLLKEARLGFGKSLGFPPLSAFAGQSLSSLHRQGQDKHSVCSSRPAQF